MPAFDSFAGCVRSKGSGDLLVLMDESGSIHQTDPSGARVTAMKYLIDRLAIRADEEQWHLDVTLAGFAEAYHPVTGWTTLTRHSVTKLKQRLDVFAGRDDGIDTDYWTAMDGAQRALRSRGRERKASSDPCQAIVLLTDGELHVDPRTTSVQRGKYGLRKPYAPGIRLNSRSAAELVTRRAQTSLCRDGGLADQLRANHIRTFAIGLGSGPQRPSFNLITSIATGAGAGKSRCGKHQADDNGYFTPAADLDDLLFAIGNLGGTSGPAGKVCRTTKPCPSGTRTFVLDDSVQRVKILAGASVPGIQVRLTAPDGRTTLPLAYRSKDTDRGSLDGMPVTWQWATPRTVMASFARRGDGPWTGRWSLTFVDPTGKHPDAVSRTILQITGDVEPTLVEPERTVFRAGTPSTGVRFGLVHAADGSPATILGDASLTVQIQSGDGSAPTVVARLDKASIGRPIDLNLGATPVGATTLLLRLQLTTQPPRGADGRPDGEGTRLQEIDVPVQIDVRPPLGSYPVPGRFVDFGEARGTTALDGSLEVSGPGCVWLDDVDVDTVPDGVRTVRVTSAADSRSSCLTVPAGARAALPLHLSLDASGSGTASGRLHLHLLPSVGDPVVVNAATAFTADSRPPARTVQRALITLLMLLLGLGLPVLTAWVAAWFTARIPSVPLRWALVDVTVRDSTVLRDGRSLTITEDELQWLTFGNARRRRVRIPNGPELRARVLPGLRSTGRVIVDAGPDRDTIARSLLPPRRFGRTHWHGLLPLAVHQNWAAVVQAPDRATLLVLFAPTADEERRAQTLAAVVDELPGALARVRATGPGPASASGPPGIDVSDATADDPDWLGEPLGRTTSRRSEPGPAEERTGWRPLRAPSASTSDVDDDDWFGDPRPSTSDRN